MTRPLRIEYPGALYHVMSRGDNKQGIFLNDHDRERFFDIYSDIVDRLGWATFAWCLMGNHFHLVVETPDPNLSEGMRLLNGIYTQYFNKNHGRVGHLFQGRFRSIVVEKNRYLLELIRYVVLNPVRSGRIDAPGDWRWSSYRATAGLEECPDWFDPGWILELVSEGVGGRESRRRQYIEFIAQGMLKEEDIMDKVRQQIYLGDESFIESVQFKCPPDGSDPDIVNEQRRKPMSFLQEYLRGYRDRREAMARAYLEGGFSQAEISKHFGVHYSTISKAVRDYKRS
jgi:REP element-mobilizing transposase RayT